MRCQQFDRHLSTTEPPGTSNACIKYQLRQFISELTFPCSHRLRRILAARITFAAQALCEGSFEDRSKTASISWFSGCVMQRHEQLPFGLRLTGPAGTPVTDGRSRWCTCCRLFRRRSTANCTQRPAGPLTGRQATCICDCTDQSGDHLMNLMNRFTHGDRSRPGFRFGRSVRSVGSEFEYGNFFVSDSKRGIEVIID